MLSVCLIIQFMVLHDGNKTIFISIFGRNRMLRRIGKVPRQLAKIRYGIIGSGMMGLEHIRNIQLLPDAEITAVTDHSVEARESTRILIGEDCKSYASHRELIASGEVDALVIATPNHTHFDLLSSIINVNCKTSSKNAF